ncbi:MAG: methyltransferase [Candidatus Saganbacteria bacterium]|nr:methyltransferase [Candidatus Saganbacteria bacterium]
MIFSNKDSNTLSCSWLPYMDRTNNYNAWVFSLIAPYIGDRIVDVGCGRGIFDEFLKAKEFVCLTEPNSDNYRILKHKFSSLPNFNLLKREIAEKDTLDLLRNKNIDTVISLNVLEHIKDDSAFLLQLRSLLERNKKIILYVPAGKAIFGSLDKNLGHYRRYNLKEIKALLNKASFRPIFYRYVNFLGYFSWFFYSRVLRRKIPNYRRILFYDRCFVPIIAFIERFIKLPFGQSILIIAESI